MPNTILVYPFFPTTCMIDFMLLIDQDVAMAPQVQYRVLWVLCKHNSPTNLSTACVFLVYLPAESMR